MPKMSGFLRSKPKIDEADWAIAEIRTAARLGDLFPTPEAATGKDAAAAASEGDETSAERLSSIVVPGSWAGGPRPPIVIVGDSDVVPTAGLAAPIAPAGAANVPAVAPAVTADATSEPKSPVFEHQVSPAKPIGVTSDAAARPAEQRAGPANPIGVMARPGDALGLDPWRPPRVAGPDAGFRPPTAAHLFPPQPPRPARPPESPVSEPTVAPIVVAEAAASAHADELAAVRTVSAEPPAAKPATTRPAANESLVGQMSLAEAPVAKRAAAAATRPAGPSRVASPASGPAKRSRARATTVGGDAQERSATGRSRTARTAAVASPTRRPIGPLKIVALVPTPVSVPKAYCPYCAKLLEPALTTSRRCDRCRQRIVVKRIDGAAIYLTEAAVLVFEAERQRVINAARWTRDRDRWLGHAAAAGAPAARVAQLTAARLSEAIVSAARKLYLTTVDRAFRAARTARDWETAAHLRREEAAVLYRVGGTPTPPQPDVVAIFQEGVAAELRGVAEIARDAELVGANCCDACRGDDRVVVRITRELRAPRLPHTGCPKGLCRCHWDLATRDRLTLRRYLRRRPGADARAPQAD